MQYTLKTLLYLTILAALTACGNGEDAYTAYFGGEISNPRVSYVVLSYADQNIDTIPLDENNRFFIKFDSLAPGLYSFKHGADYQYVFFDRNDSLMVSVNSADFDRSIVFSGRGEQKNNFLMELYLLHEEDRTKGYGIYDYSYNDFKKAIDSTYALRKAFYERSKQGIKWSDDFDYFALNRLNFNYFTKREYYPYIHARRTGKDVRPYLPDDFYHFRNSINFDDPKLTQFSPFVRYLTAMLNNMAISRGQRGNDKAENSLRDNIAKLNIADSIFSNENIKNEILDNIAFSYLLEDQNIANNQKFLQHFMQVSTDDSEANEIKRMSKAIQRLNKGARLPQVELVDAGNKYYGIENDIGKETVIFFWTGCAQTHMKMVFDKVASLKNEHPHVNFIAVNVDKDEEWRKIPNFTAFEHAMQLRAANFNVLKEKWVLTKINRTIILNADGTIKNAFTDLMSNDFKMQLQNNSL